MNFKIWQINELSLYGREFVPLVSQASDRHFLSQLRQLLFSWIPTTLGILEIRVRWEEVNLWFLALNRQNMILSLLKLFYSIIVGLAFWKLQSLFPFQEFPLFALTASETRFWNSRTGRSSHSYLLISKSVVRSTGTGKTFFFKISVLEDACSKDVSVM